tara:strand:- start:4730 stop:5080 length:351 start_codon:yes stop_codon:yes gene_type:complete
MSRIVEKPWGHEMIWAETDKYVGKYLYIKAGNRLSRQYHEMKDETILVIGGKLTLEVGEGPDAKTLILGNYESYHIEPGTVHRFGAAQRPVHLVEVSTTELDDVVRIEDDYGREST